MFLKKINYRQSSVVSLILTTIILFCLAVYYKLALFDIILIFWTETVIIAFFNFFKMLKTNRLPKLDKSTFNETKSNEEMLLTVGKFMLVFFKFFTILWSSILLVGFCLFSLVLIVIIFGEESIRNSREFPVQQLSSFIIGAVAIFISHGISFVVNFLGKKEWEQLKLRNLIFIPFRRILIVWVAIFLGGLALLLLKNESIYLLIPYFLIRLFFDLRQHYKEHQGALEKTI